MSNKFEYQLVLTSVLWNTAYQWRTDEFVLGCTAETRRAEIRGRRPRTERSS